MRLFDRLTNLETTIKHIQTFIAPKWRWLIRAIIVILGFACFCGIQYQLAQAINQSAWLLVAGFFAMGVVIALSVFRPLVMFIVWIVVSPLIRHFLNFDTGSAALPVINFDLIAIYCLASVMLFRALFNRKPLHRLIPGEWFLIAFTLYIAASQVARLEFTGIADTLQPFTRLLIPDILIVVVLYFVAKAVIQRKEHLSWICVGMSVFGLILGLSAFYEHFTGNRWYSIIVGQAIPLAWTDIGQGRASGMFDHASAPSSIFATGFFLCYHLANYTKRGWAKLFYYTTMVALAFGIFFTYTRNVYIAFILFTLAIPVLAVGNRKRFAALSLLIVLLVAAIVPTALSDSAFNYRLTNSENMDARLIYAKTSLNVIRHFPIFGVGYGNLNEVQKNYAASLKHWNTTPGKLGFLNISHNTYLTILAEEGIVGMSIYAIAIIAFFIRAFRLRARMPREGLLNRDFVSMMIISCGLFLVAMITTSIYMVPYVHFVFWIQFAFVVRLEELLVEEQKLKENTARILEDNILSPV